MEDQRHLFDEAIRCRRLAANITDVRTVKRLRELADEYEAKFRAAQRHRNDV